MSDHQPKPDKTLSEISHLFLSSVRERQMDGAARPQRRPPQQPLQSPLQSQSAEHVQHDPILEAVRTDAEIDLTPEEFAQVLAGPEPRTADEPHVPVAALLAGHLGAAQLERAREYAAYHASGGARVGLIEVDASEFRLWIFEPSNQIDLPQRAQPEATESLDARRMSEALAELAHDIDQWFVLLPTPRANEGRAVLRGLERWVLLCSSDHDGIVAAYRTLKGLSESHQRNESPDATLPRLSLAVLNARDPAEASRVFAKLAAVCQQFLHWPIEAEPPVSRAAGVTEQLVLSCRSTRDKAQLAAAPQWQVVTNFLKHLRTTAPRPQPAQPQEHAPQLQPPDVRTVAQDFVAWRHSHPLHAAPSHAADGQAEPGRPRPRRDATPDVIDLPADSSTPEAIVAAVLRGNGDLVECPVHPPMCPHASLAVSRDRRLVLVALAQQGLSDLRAIGEAWRWLMENRPLIGMAIPQFAIDALQLPRLHLLVDHADMTAEVLQPMVQSGHVTVHAYRKLRWGGKTGLLLEAA